MAAKKIKRTITLAQLVNRGTYDRPESYVYQVMSLQNALEPAVNQKLHPEEVAAMIDVGWTVNVKETK